MATVSPSSAQSISGAAWQQLQKQQAQRAADKAEQDAGALKAKAQAAEVVALRAQENARSLDVQYGQAVSDAVAARRGLSASAQVESVRQDFEARSGQIASALSSLSELPTVPSAVLNAQGQQTGTLVNVTA